MTQKSSSPLVSGLVKNRLFKTARDINELPFQFIRTTASSLVDTTLHNRPLLLQFFKGNYFISLFGTEPPVPF